MSKKIRKILSAVLVLTMMICVFAGCSGNKTPNEPSSGAGTSEEGSNSVSGKVYKVGICQGAQHPALDAATQGFKDALTEKLGSNVQFDEQNASGEITNCTTIVSKFVSDNVDLIMANATDALSAASNATADIPIVATSITDFATALQIKDWNGKTGTNVTGTADLAPLEEQAAMIKELFPDAKKVGILYCSAEPNSKYQSDIVEAELKKLGYECEIFTFVDTNDVTAVTQNAVDKSDVIYIPTDNKAASNTEAINNIAEPAGVPIVAGEEGICKGCGIATLSISYYGIGHRAGEMAYEILVNGKNPGDMEIEYTTDLTKKYYADRAAALNIEIPTDYEAIAE